MRMLNVVNSKNEIVGTLEIGYIYRNGDLTSLPEVSTIIPKPISNTSE